MTPIWHIRKGRQSDLPRSEKMYRSIYLRSNTPSRWGTQAPFSNITLDWTVPADLAELPAIVGGKEMDFKYKDCKKEMDMVNRAFLEIMIEAMPMVVDSSIRSLLIPLPEILTGLIPRTTDCSLK